MFTGIMIGILLILSALNFLAWAGFNKILQDKFQTQRSVNLSLMELVDNLHKKIKETERMHMQ